MESLYEAMRPPEKRYEQCPVLVAARIVALGHDISAAAQLRYQGITDVDEQLTRSQTEVAALRKEDWYVSKLNTTIAEMDIASNLTNMPHKQTAIQLAEQVQALSPR